MSLDQPGIDSPENNPSEETDAATSLSLTDFISSFGAGLLDAVQAQNAPVYNRDPGRDRAEVMTRLTRRLFDEQQHVVQACARLLLDHGERACVVNGEMGSGKTIMAIALAAVMSAEGFSRTLVVCPPHLVYKWRREIKQTVPDASVWILNGPDTLRKLLMLRSMRDRPKVPTFFIMGRVRMRMGFNWKPAFATRTVYERAETGEWFAKRVAACPRCGEPIRGDDLDGLPHELGPTEALEALNSKQTQCVNCREALWTLFRSGQARSTEEVLTEALQQIPTIGEKTAAKLLKIFGSDRIGNMLEDNVHEFINLMNQDGELMFSDRQARRMERSMANKEFSFGTGGYQPSEFVKRYLPKGYFDTLVADEGHEFKNEGSAQGQAFGVISSQCRKAVLLTGTLMGGYADDLFYLLWRLNPQLMIEDGFTARDGSLTSASMAYMREHGVLKDIYKESGADEQRAYRTAKGKSRVTHRVVKAPGFSPVGIMRYVLPITAFLRLKDIGGNVLPPYKEQLLSLSMTEEQAGLYLNLSLRLKEELSKALVCGDRTLLGVVLNVLLAWPDCAFRSEMVYHPRTRALLASVPRLFGDDELSPKEAELVTLCKAAKARGRRVLVYTTYTGVRDTTSRLRHLLELQGFKVAVLRTSVDAADREDWILEKVDQGCDVIVTNPELVKTGLDMMEFPTIVFMQSGYNVYTLQQASRRSWRIGQKADVEVYFLGYKGSAQEGCLQLMAKKIAVSQSTSGEMPETGLDVLNDTGDSIEVELARQLLAA